MTSSPVVRVLIEWSYHHHHHHHQHCAGIKATVELDLPTMLKAKEKAVGTLTKGVEGLFSKYSTLTHITLSHTLTHSQRSTTSRATAR